MDERNVTPSQDDSTSGEDRTKGMGGGVLPLHPSRRFSMKERCFRYMPLLCIVVCAVAFLAVFAVMGRAVGIPYFVGGGIFGWYVRKWMQTKRK